MDITLVGLVGEINSIALRISDELLRIFQHMNPIRGASSGYNNSCGLLPMPISIKPRIEQVLHCNKNKLYP